ncbi:MAG: hypothetical protein WBL68_13505 [Nitrososphaeraceae archaeon]
MVLYGLLCGLGVEGGLILGLTAAEVLAGYWNNKNRTNPTGSPPSPPQKVYFFNRRMHHGQIGALLMLSLFFRGTPIPAAILAGLGIGLVKDDYADFKEWFLFKKKDENENEKSSKPDYDNDYYSGNQEVIEGYLHGENIDVTASNKPFLLSVYKRIVTVVEAQFESVSDIKSQSRELRRQRICTYYRFKRWEKVNR